MLRSTPGEAQRTWLVQFYTPWCSRCRKFHDAWSELAAATPGQRSAAAELRLARLDAAASPAVIGRFGLRGFPAFLLFDGAQFHRYRGELSLAGLQSFVGSGGGSAHPEAVREASAEFAPTTFRADEQTDRQLMTELGPHRPPHRRPLPDRTLTDRPPPCAQASRSRRSASCSASCSAASAACAGAPACSRAACAAATVGSRRRRKGTERRRPTERARARRCCAPGAPTLSQFCSRYLAIARAFGRFLPTALDRAEQVVECLAQACWLQPHSSPCATTHRRLLVGRRGRPRDSYLPTCHALTSPFLPTRSSSRRTRLGVGRCKWCSRPCHRPCSAAHLLASPSHLAPSLRPPSQLLTLFTPCL